MNLVPAQYREVSVTEVPVPLEEGALRGYLAGRPVYRRTRYVIARNGDACMVAEVSKESEQPLFSPVTSVTVLARADETTMVDAPDIDTAVPTQLARAAAGHAPGARCVIVRGLYGHVSFILDPAPVRVRVLEVVPPWPPKLVDQLSRVLDLAEDLPPVELVPELVDLRDLAARRPAARYLFPCRAGHGAQDQAEISLPGRDPAPRAVDAGRVRPLPGHPRLVLRRRGAAGGHVPAQPGPPGRPAADQVLPARGPGRQRRGHGGGALGGQPGADLRRPAPGGGGAARPARPMTDRIADSALYRHLWGTDEARAVLGEEGRLSGWLEVITALAQVQAEAGLIPARAAELIAEHARADRIDLAYAAEQTRQSSHSMLGLIRALQAVLPEQARDYVYAGATVQDITDTWTSLALRRIGGLVWRDLRRIEERLLELAAGHRDTVMAGRTHGQPGSPVTFGWKAASWADEIRRHLDRLRDGAPRWLVGQLGGGTGSLVFHGEQGLAVRARFCAVLGLADPGISWLTARDRGAEFAQLLALICGTLARIGGEVYELQRPEIGELREAAAAGTVGSITMPHKRNPEASEHLDTLARLARSSASVMSEAVVQQHERDGRGWKAEWVAWPETCLLATAALQIAVGLTAGLTVDAEAMRANLVRYGGYPVSERALALLTPRLGARRAQDALQQALGQGRAAGLTAEQALARSALFSAVEAGELTAAPDAGCCPQMTDLVIARARAARAAEPAEWP